MSEEKKNEILGEKLDFEELEAVSGGEPPEYCNQGMNYDMHGGCTRNYYKQNCTATVEDGSHCWSNDRCYFSSEKYDKN